MPEIQHHPTARPIFLALHTIQAAKSIARRFPGDYVVNPGPNKIREVWPDAKTMQQFEEENCDNRVTK
jgi:hypothetical protein